MSAHPHAPAPTFGERIAALLRPFFTAAQEAAQKTTDPTLTTRRNTLRGALDLAGEASAREAHLDRENERLRLDLARLELHAASLQDRLLRAQHRVSYLEGRLKDAQAPARVARFKQGPGQPGPRAEGVTA